MSQNTLHIAGLGVPGGGTGTLLSLLQMHPAVRSPITSSSALAKAPVSQGAVAELATLQSSVAGELAGVYLTHTFGQPDVAARIVEHLPAAKLLLVVRNPIDCLISAYEVARHKGHTLPNESCAAFVSRQADLQMAVRYSAALAELFSYYGPTSLHLVLYEDLAEQPVTTMRNVFSFLAIDETFIPSTIKYYATSDDEPAKRAWWRRLVLWLAGPIMRRLKKTPVPVVPPPYVMSEYFSAIEYASLFSWYRDDMVQLSTYLDKDLVAAWDQTWEESGTSA